MTPEKDKPYWLDKTSNINKLVYLLYVACAALLIVDFIYHKHGHFSFEHWFGFYAWFGFLAYISIVMTAKLLRKFIRRDEDYYD